MNLVQFLNKVDETISGYDCEKLLRIIHEIARTLPEQERKDFIKQIKQIDNNDTSNINKKDNNKLETEYKKICDKFIEIENGDIVNHCKTSGPSLHKYYKYPKFVEGQFSITNLGREFISTCID